MRTIPKAYEEIKKIDPDTSFSMRALRRMVNNGEIPTIKVASKNLINLDLLLEILSCQNYNMDATYVLWLERGDYKHWQPLLKE